jgi:hypothetical protein
MSSTAKMSGISDYDSFSLSFVRIFTFVICFCLIYSIISSMFTSVCYECKASAYEDLNMPIGCQRRFEPVIVENFDNISDDKLYSFKSQPVARYHNIELTAVLDEDGNPTSFQTGNAVRHVYSKNNKMIYRLDISSNLYVLDGNVFKNGAEKLDHSYKAYLLNDKNEKFLLGNLKKDGDGMYKVKFENDKVSDLVKFNKIQIIYSQSTGDKTQDTLILEGTF